MEKEKNDKVEPDKAPKEKKPLTEEQRIKRNKMIAIPCMFLVCGLVLWLIFKPSASEGEKGSKGFNMEMPDAEKTDVEADKRKAYSKEDLANKQKEKSRAMNTLGEYMPGIDSTATRQEGDFDLMQSGQQPTKAERQEADAIRSSAEAYRTLNTTLGGFYEQPQQGGSSEDAELRKRLDELEASMMQQENKRSNMDEQVALMEKSYPTCGKVHAWWKCQCGKSFISRNCNRGKQGSCHQGQESQGFPCKASAKACSLVLEPPHE